MEVYYNGVYVASVAKLVKWRYLFRTVCCDWWKHRYM